ncbi:homing endonuclease associated repeat-containing protein [Halovenus sp. HT40]|uniref:homing endonuclease associated repeat-containing protein n=1 Tax=Halovenus sp. HT40 TaxID=3126691 RepID=UPI00300F5257
MTTHTSNGQRVPTNDLIADIKQTADRVDGPLTKTEYREHGEHTRKTVVNRFGSWNEMKHELGLEISSKTSEGPRLTTDELLADLRATAEKAGSQHRVDNAYYHEVGSYSVSVYKDRFGSWTEAKQAADLPPQHMIPISADGCVDSVRVVAERVDGNLTCAAYDDHRRPIDPSSVTVIDRVGSWTEAKQQAGVE